MERMRELHLFAGAGGGILGGMLLGHTCRVAVEINPFRRNRLLQHQREGILPWFPIWDDARTFDPQPWKGVVDTVCSGFPCRRFSLAGNIHGSDYYDGWPDTRRVIEQLRPRTVFLENVPAILVLYWGTILNDLARLGYHVRWGLFCCPDVSKDAPQIGARLFAMAQTDWNGQQTVQLRLAERTKAWQPTLPSTATCSVWSQGIPEPSIPGVPDGMADYMGQIDAIGDGQVPAVVKLAWETLSQ